MVGSVPTPVVHAQREISGFEVRLVHLLFSERDQSLKSEKIQQNLSILWSRNVLDWMVGGD